MTPQERDLIETLLDRLRSIGAAGQRKDREAEALIRQAVREQPDMPYYLAQTVLIQDLSLAEAQNRIAELEQQLEASTTQGSSGTSFLGSLFSQREQAVPPPARSAGPWSRRPQERPQHSAHGQPRDPQQGPGLPASGQQQTPGGPMGSGQMGGGFLRSAAATAAGVAGGAMLFHGISSLFGQGYANSLYSGGGANPGLSESAIGNQAGDYGDYSDAGYSGGGPDDGGDYGGGDYDDGDDYGGGSDFGGDDF
jgi:uncharacterized protein